MDRYLIQYRERVGKKYLVGMPNMEKLLAWIKANAARCRSITILVVSNQEEKKA